MSCDLFNITFIPNKKNYMIFINNSELKLSTPKMSVPFGIERFNNKYIANLEFTDLDNKNMTQFHNTILAIDRFLMRLSSDKNIIKKFNNKSVYTKNLLYDIYDKTYTSCIKNRNYHPPLLRTYVKDPSIYNDIKGMNGHFKLHISTVWISKYNYGSIYYLNDMI